MSFGDRIKLARQMTNMSLRELANKAGVSATAISKYERGLDIPGSDVLIRLAQSLNVKVEFFFRSRETEVKVQAFRKNAKLSKKTENMIIGQIREWIERYLEVEDLFAGSKSPRPDFGFDTRISRLEDVERVAEELRRYWQLGLDPIDNLTELLEDKGIKIGFVDSSSDFVGCTFELDNSDKVIVVSRSIPGDRQRFTIAHELGHIVMEIGEGVNHEKAANRFAGAFLVPKQAALEELGRKRSSISMLELHLLKHKYGLSMQGWIYRAKDLGIISETLAARMFAYFRKRGDHLMEPGVPIKQEKPQRMERLIIRALEEHMISEVRASELLGKPVKKFLTEIAAEHNGLYCD